MVLPETISDDEFLYRAIKRSRPDWLDGGKPTSAMYKDYGGNSVDRDGKRELSQIIDFMRNGHLFPRVKGIVEIEAAKCLEIGTVVIAAPSDDDVFHANILLNTEDINIQNLRALQLADASRIVFEDDDMKWVEL